MPSSRIEFLAQALSPVPVKAISEIRRGANSRVFALETIEGKRYALKLYPENDQRGRQLTEVRALSFFEQVGLDCVPRLVTVDEGLHCSLLSWVDGVPLVDLDEKDVCQFVDFQKALHDGRERSAAKLIGEASEACLSGVRILNHIETRLNKLAAIQEGVPEINEILDDGLKPALVSFETAARREFDKLRLDFDADLAVSERTLIASDFGAHNALRNQGGGISFLDFEYLGWDDPLTSIANFLLHPAMQLTIGQKDLFRNEVLDHLDGGEAREKLEVLMPLYAIRWCAIILSELLPQKWQQRAAANADYSDWSKVKSCQIEKAHKLLADYW